MKPYSNALTLIVLGIASVALGGQDEGMSKHTPRAVKTTEAPVTQDEARSTFSRAELMLRKTLGMPVGKPSVSIPSGAKPVKRSQVVAEFSRLYSVLKPQVKLTPKATPFDAKVVHLTDAKQKANLLALIKMGAVAKIGPLATGPGDTLTVPEFGDAVGFFMSRMAYMTHLPSPDWSANLKKD